MKCFLVVLSVSFIFQRKLINNTVICLEALGNTREDHHQPRPWMEEEKDTEPLLLKPALKAGEAECTAQSHSASQ